MYTSIVQIFFWQKIVEIYLSMLGTSLIYFSSLGVMYNLETHNVNTVIMIQFDCFW